MDKYDLVLDIIEHPENYTSQQLTVIMSDSETRGIYNLLCKTESAISTNNEPDVNSEWKIFSNTHSVRPHHKSSWLGNRAASIAAVVGSSIVAVAAGIAVTVSVADNKTEKLIKEEIVTHDIISTTVDTLTAGKDKVNVRLTPIMFENETLENIMDVIAETYGVEVKFNNRDVSTLHLYYKLDLSLPLSEVLEQLNTFEQINIKQRGNLLTID